jgi:hypothetical protein
MLRLASLRYPQVCAEALECASEMHLERMTKRCHVVNRMCFLQFRVQDCAFDLQLMKMKFDTGKHQLNELQNKVRDNEGIKLVFGLIEMTPEALAHFYSNCYLMLSVAFGSWVAPIALGDMNEESIEKLRSIVASCYAKVASSPNTWLAFYTLIMAGGWSIVPIMCLHLGIVLWKGYSVYQLLPAQLSVANDSAEEPFTNDPTVNNTDVSVSQLLQ